MESNEVKEIDIADFLGRVKKYWWVIAITALFITLVTSCINYLYMKNVYQASTTLYVGRMSQSTISSLLQELQVGQNVIKDYSEIVKSRTVMKETKKALEQEAESNPDLEDVAKLSYKKISEKVSVGLLKDTKMMEIKVKDGDPEVCAIVADKVAAIFMEKVTKITKIENIEIVDVAEIPDTPVAPSRTKNIMIGFVFGIVVGVGIVVVIWLLDNTIKNSSDVKNYLKLPVMGVVNKFEKNSGNEIGPELVTLNIPKSSISESYRIIRSNIQFSAMDKELKSLLVTGSGPHEGKSVTSANLAVVFANAGSHVLLIDGDLRKPTLHNVMKLSNKEGLTNILSGNKDSKSYVIKTEVENLEFLASGPIPPNPSEVLGTKAMKNFMEEIKKNYDMVIIDSPPVGLVTDAQILSTLVDGTLLVAASSEVKVDAAKKAIEFLHNVNANILGVVLNKVKAKESEYYSYEEVSGEKVKRVKKSKK